MKYIFVSNLFLCPASVFAKTIHSNLLRYKSDSHYFPNGFLCENGVEILFFRDGQINIYSENSGIWLSSPEESVRTKKFVQDFIKYYYKKYL